jgi:hypothetical protein
MIWSCRRFWCHGISIDSDDDQDLGKVVGDISGGAGAVLSYVGSVVVQ